MCLGLGNLTSRILNKSDAPTRQPYLHTNPTRRRDDRIYTQLRCVDATAPESTSNPTCRRDSLEIPLKSDASTRQIQHPLKDCQCPGLCFGLQRLLCHSTARLAWRNLNLNAIPRSQPRTSSHLLVSPRITSHLLVSPRISSHLPALPRISWYPLFASSLPFLCRGASVGKREPKRHGPVPASYSSHLLVSLNMTSNKLVSHRISSHLVALPRISWCPLCTSSHLLL